MTLRSALLNNLSLKLLALILAVGCWFYIGNFTTPQEDMFSKKVFEDIPVKILTSPAEGISVELLTTEVAIGLKGQDWHLQKLRAHDIGAYIEVSGLDPGTWEVGLQLIVPKEVTIESKPATIRVIITSDDPETLEAE